MINNIQSTTPSAMTGLGSQPKAPADAVQQFGQLLTGMNNALSNGQSALTADAPLATPRKGDMLEDTAVRLNKAEVGLQEIKREVDKATQGLYGAMTLGSDFTKSIVYQQFTSATYFVNVSRVESGASNVSDELESITRKR